MESEIHAYITLTEELALEQAAKADEKFKRGDEVNALTGIPMAIKDVICAKGFKTTCASKILSPFVSPYDATVMKKLNSAGVVMVGKANMDEFAMGSSTEHSHFGITKNPWDLATIPGGSSGGSAAAVAADEAICALGSDTGGSIRQPAALCGIVGLKPTYGRVSRFGLVAFASSLDQIGPLTKDITDCALVMNVIAGHDPMDSTSADIPAPDYTKALTGDIKGIRVGIPKEYFIEGMDKEVEKSIYEAIDRLKKLGAICDETSLPHTDHAIAVYYIIASAEASANLARYDGVRYGYRAEGGSNLIEMYRKTRSEGFGSEVKRRIMLGTYALSSGYYDAYYLKAQKVRTLIKKDFDQAFEKFDVIVCPTSPTAAFKIGEKTGDPLQMYLSDVFTVPINIAGVCGISIPCGFTSTGLPIGLQIIGKPFDEETVLKVAYAYEQNTEHHLRKPKV
jgi:aspartyl-tRNA(Asn)/glutamyl-tRNA(Gln) amidotransferase subunit A